MAKYFINERLLPLAANPDTLLVYPHTPRTGGVAIRTQLLTRVFGQDKIYNRHYTPDPARWKRLSERELKGYRVYTELDYCRNIGLRRPTLYIATLRHPVYRAASLYSFVKRKDTHRDHRLAVEHPMEEFYRRASAVAPQYYCDAQCQRIAGRRDARRALDLIGEKYIGVGLTNHLADFGLELCRIFGWPPIELDRRPPDPERYDAKISPAFRDMVLANNRQDMTLYDAIAAGPPQPQVASPPSVLAAEATRLAAMLRARATRLVLGRSGKKTKGVLDAAMVPQEEQ